MSAVRASMSQWRFASRLARREVRRRPGRTLLVTLLVAVPVLAMTVASVVYRTQHASDSFERRWPDGTDLVVVHPVGSEFDASVLPAGTTTSEVVGAEWAAIETSAGQLIDGVSIWGQRQLGPGSPLSISEGTAPSAGEVWISEALGDRLGIGLGDELSLTHPTGTWIVTGIGKFADDYDKNLLIVPDLPTEQFRKRAVRAATLVDLPGTPNAETLQRIEATVNSGPNPGVSESRAWYQYGNENRLAIPLGWVAGAVALAAMGIIVAAAFATSARRQLVTLGQLSASGTPGGLLRRTLALQGSWTGLLGTVMGMGVGVAGLLATRGFIERRMGYLLEPYRFVITDLVIIAFTGIAAATIAALIPARSAAKVPVMAALAGRRPVGVVPRRLVPIGLGLFAFGIFLLVVAATGEPSSSTSPNYPIVTAAVIGALLVPAGMCCCSPLAVDAMSRATAMIGRSWRFSGRSLARTRTRTAAVVTAIAVTGGIAVAGSSMALYVDSGAGDGGSGGERGYKLEFPSDAAVLTPPLPIHEDRRGRADPAPLDEHPASGTLREAVTSALPDSQWIPRQVATYDAAPIGSNANDPDTGDKRTDGSVIHHLPEDARGSGSLVIADVEIMDLYDLSEADRSALDAGQVIVLDEFALSSMPPSPDPFDLVLRTEDRDITVPAVPNEMMREFLAADASGDAAYYSGTADDTSLLISEAAARDAGLDVVTRGAIIRADQPLTQQQKDALGDAVYGGFPLGEIYRDVPRNSTLAESDWNVSYDYSDDGTPQVAIQGAILGAALLLTLIVVAIGLSLAAAEGREERDVLVAVGARPATMRSMAGIKAMVMTLTGALLAVPTAVLPVAIVSRAVDEPFFMPWLAIGALVVVIPLLAGLTTWLASNIAQRVRPVQMSTLAID